MIDIIPQPRVNPVNSVNPRSEDSRKDFGRKVIPFLEVDGEALGGRCSAGADKGRQRTGPETSASNMVSHVAMQGLSSLCFVAAIVSAGASAAQRNEWRDRHSAMERTAGFERPAFFVHH